MAKSKKTPKTIVEQLRARADLLDRRCTISESDVYREIADHIESGLVYDERYRNSLTWTTT